MSVHTEINSRPDAHAVNGAEIEVRECTTVDEFDACVRLQREMFGLPEIELSPRRHLIVSRSAGGWILGAFVGDELIGFVHHLAAVRGREVIGYSHMMAVAAAYQNLGVGARLKWAQRARALDEGVDFIKWTWEPVRARNAHFNINRLGVVVRSYAVNFYGTDYNTLAGMDGERHGIDSDRLFAEWELRAPRVEALAAATNDTRGATREATSGNITSGKATRKTTSGKTTSGKTTTGARVSNHVPVVMAAVEIPPDWGALVRDDAATARREQLRVREEFQQALARRYVCAGFDRDPAHPRYLFYTDDDR